MSPRPAVSILKVASDVPDLLMAAGDFLLVKPDGTPLGLIRKLEGDSAASCFERFGLSAALVTLDNHAGPAEPSAIDLLRGTVGE